VKISDKWKAVVAAFGTFAAALAAAAEDSHIELAEAGGIGLAAFAVGAAVWAVRNKPA
jgi:hypothetical protein